MSSFTAGDRVTYQGRPGVVKGQTGSLQQFVEVLWEGSHGGYVATIDSRLLQPADCMACEAPAQPAPAGSLPLCDHHNPGGEPVSAAEHLESCTPCSHDQTVGELGGMTVSGDSDQCAKCGEEVIRW